MDEWVLSIQFVYEAFLRPLNRSAGYKEEGDQRSLFAQYASELVE